MCVKLEAGLKHHTSRERYKEGSWQERVVIINHPPTENDTVNVAREYSWSQNVLLVLALQISYILR